MSSKTYTDVELDNIYKILNFRLPHVFKSIGFAGAFMVFTGLLLYKYMGSNLLFIKDILRICLLLFMFIASISKDKFEDEYNQHIRHQSFVIAFIIAVGYAILIPLFALILETLVTKITGDGNINIFEVSAFEVLFTLIGIQLLYFETLKRLSSAK